MTFVVPAELAARIYRHCAAGYPREACGFLIGTWAGAVARLEAVDEAANTRADERSDYFEIDPRHYRDVEKALRGTGKSILGFYHSHPDHPDVPSYTDLSFAQGWPGFLWTIVQVVAGTAVSLQTYTLSDDGARFVRVATEIARLVPPEHKREAYARMEADLARGNS
jgi:proteasome lid subunit RPN8/RPN11